MSCVLENIEYLADSTDYWTVDEEGQPDLFLSSSDQSDFREYYCDSCQNHFENWEKVKEHLDD